MRSDKKPHQTQKKVRSLLLVSFLHFLCLCTHHVKTPTKTASNTTPPTTTMMIIQRRRAENESKLVTLNLKDHREKGKDYQERRRTGGEDISPEERHSGGVGTTILKMNTTVRKTGEGGGGG